jgi:hypothetical protein
MTKIGLDIENWARNSSSPKNLLKHPQKYLKLALIFKQIRAKKVAIDYNPLFPRKK